jgi:hypothetical protein
LTDNLSSSSATAAPGAGPADDTTPGRASRNDSSRASYVTNLSVNFAHNWSGVGGDGSSCDPDDPAAALGGASACFALNGNPTDPNVCGVEGIVDAYNAALDQFTPSGPTLMAPAIDRAARQAELAAERGGCVEGGKKNCLFVCLFFLRKVCD